MIKYGIFLLACAAGALAAAVPGVESALEARLVKYDGPRYELSEEDKRSLLHAHATGGHWERPRDMPIINVTEPGTVIDFGLGDVADGGSLEKRDGWRRITAYRNYGCLDGVKSPDDLIVTVRNFGCGTGCINIYTNGHSGFVEQQMHGNPYPTMDVWSDFNCGGTRMQHYGVRDTASCTDATGNGYRSFIGYYDCKH